MANQLPWRLRVMGRAWSVHPRLFARLWQCVIITSALLRLLICFSSVLLRLLICFSSVLLRLLIWVFTGGVDKPVGPGCTGPRVATAAPLCLPTAPTYTTHRGQDRQGASQSTSGSPQMARESVVPHTRQTTRGGASLSPCAGRPPLAAGGPSLAPGPSSGYGLWGAWALVRGVQPCGGADHPVLPRTLHQGALCQSMETFCQLVSSTPPGTNTLPYTGYRRGITGWMECQWGPTLWVVSLKGLSDWDPLNEAQGLLGTYHWFYRC